MKITLYILLLVCCNFLSEARSYIAHTDSALFIDDLTKDTAGALPIGWRICVCNGNKYDLDTKHCKVVEIAGMKAIALYDLSGWVKSIEPALTPDIYLPDSFTLEFDFMPSAAGSMMDVGFVGLQNKCQGNGLMIYSRDGKNYVLEHEGTYDPSEPEQKHFIDDYPLPKQYRHTTWHHFELSYTKGLMSCSVDGALLMKQKDCHYAPGSFNFSCRHGFTLYRNVILRGSQQRPVLK
jgi:hypothetical protein